MPDDLFEQRRTGLRRVHAVTASVATAAVVGTGATALVLASADQASARQTTPVQQGSDEGTDGGSDDGGGVVGPSAPQDGVQQPAAPPSRASGGGSGHASSGGS